jgi:hypothetical protein
VFDYVNIDCDHGIVWRKEFGMLTSLEVQHTTGRLRNNFPSHRNCYVLDITSVLSRRNSLHGSWHLEGHLIARCLSRYTFLDFEAGFERPLRTLTNRKNWQAGRIAASGSP